MADSTRQSDHIMRAAGSSLQAQRSGGRRQSLGTRSARMKYRHWMKKLRRIVLAVAAVWMTALVAGLAIDGIGFTGVMLTLLATFMAIFIFSSYPKLKTPKRTDLAKGDVRQMVGKTELWLEHQRPALPPPAARLVSDMGVQLDALGLQLDHIDPAHPAAREIRSLVGDVLPETIESYRKIPAHMRSEKHAGQTPDDQLTDSLSKISREIDSVTRQLAEGSLDKLAIRNRYLDYKYGNGDDSSPETPQTDTQKDN
ncbi:MAG: DUF6703 family protein [Sphingomonadaceae bacterium]